MKLTEKEPDDSENVSEDERERPEDWERVSSDDLPEPTYDGYSLPHPNDLTRVPADEFYDES